jgi:acetyl esterase/lipase
LNYRLAPEYPFPAQLEDVKCAVRSFRANAEQYGIDPDRIGVWGPSAGGHLVNMLGVTDPAAGFERGEYLDQSSRVQAVVDLFGPADLTIDFSRTFVNLKASVFANYDLAKASPITYISPDDPPFLILQGDRDRVVPLSQSQLLYEAMIAGGMQAELVVVKDGDHGFTDPNTTPNREEITAMIVKFFEEQLK